MQRLDGRPGEAPGQHPTETVLSEEVVRHILEHALSGNTEPLLTEPARRPARVPETLLALPEVLGHVAELPGMESPGIGVLDRSEEGTSEAHGEHPTQVVLAERGGRYPLRDVADGDTLDLLDHPASRLGGELEPIGALPHALDIELPLVESVRVGVVDRLVRRPVEAAAEHPGETVLVEQLLVDRPRNVHHGDAELILKEVPGDDRGA